MAQEKGLPQGGSNSPRCRGLHVGAPLPRRSSVSAQGRRGRGRRRVRPRISLIASRSASFVCAFRPACSSRTWGWSRAAAGRRLHRRTSRSTLPLAPAPGVPGVRATARQRRRPCVPGRTAPTPGWAGAAPYLWLTQPWMRGASCPCSTLIRSGTFDHCTISTCPPARWRAAMLWPSTVTSSPGARCVQCVKSIARPAWNLSTITSQRPGAK